MVFKLVLRSLRSTGSPVRRGHNQESYNGRVLWERDGNIKRKRERDGEIKRKRERDGEIKRKRERWRDRETERGVVCVCLTNNGGFAVFSLNCFLLFVFHLIS